MNPLILSLIITALSGAQDWNADKFRLFCQDIEPLIDKIEITYMQLSPLYDKYIHRLDKIDMVLKEIEK